jgi:sugar phosphate isomerase/epimerase
MRLALSTNWNNVRLKDGEAIVDEAISLGFDALELGFKTTSHQIEGFKRRLDEMPIDSIHAYCPVPVGAPSGHPELYQLLSKSSDTRALARCLLRDSIECAVELGAKTIVFHAGYVSLMTFFKSYGDNALRLCLGKVKGDVKSSQYAKMASKALALRAKRGKKKLDLFKREFDQVLPNLEKNKITLALENLPRIEGFPNVEEAQLLMKAYEGAPLKLWLDTGHAKVQSFFNWAPSEARLAEELSASIVGIHLNDVEGFHDDHRQPGWGNVDFASLKNLAQKEDVLRVFEPHSPVGFDELKESVAYIRKLWSPREESAD